MKRVVAGFLIMSIATIAHAEIFLCKDAAGHSYTSDRPIPECAGQAVREYANSGMLKRRIAAPPTAAQLQVRREQEEKKRAELAAQQEQRNEDRALLARYHSEDDIEQARQRDSLPWKKQLQQQKAGVALAEREAQAAQGALDARKKKGAMPAGPKTDSGGAVADLRSARAELADSESRLAQIDKKYDAILQRYRELTHTRTASLR